MNNYRSLLKDIYNLAWPVIVGQVGHIMMAIVDNVMVGQLGAEDLAAAALANSIFVLFMVLGLGVSFALSPLVSMALGKKDMEEYQQLLPHGLLVNMAGAVIIFIVLIFVARIIPFLDQPAAVVEKSQPYLLLLGLSMFPLMAFQTYKQYIEGLSIMRPAMVITLAANIVNYFGNKALIYGNWGFPEMGLNGAGISTLFTRLFMALIIVLFLYRSKYMHEYSLSLRIPNINWQTVKRIYKLGLASGFQYFFEVGCFTFAIIMIGWFGASPQAAHQIALNLASISYMFALGISAATAILIGRAFGEKNWIKLRRTGIVSIFLGIANMSVFGIAFIVGKDYWPSLYTPDIEVQKIASTLLVIAAFFQVFDGAQAVGIGILRGMGDIKFPTVITFASYWLVGITTAYVFGFWFNLKTSGVWIGLSIGLGSAAVLLLWRFLYLSRRL